MANRFDSIPRHIWERGTSQHLKLLSRDLEAVERALREGGVPVSTQAVTVPTGAAPVAADSLGTGQDTVTLTKVDGVTWVVNGVEHPSGSFTDTTKTVAFAGGTATEVTAKAEPGYTLQGTASWNLGFTDVRPANNAPYADIAAFLPPVEPVPDGEVKTRNLIVFNTSTAFPTQAEWTSPSRIELRIQNPADSGKNLYVGYGLLDNYNHQGQPDTVPPGSEWVSDPNDARPVFARSETTPSIWATIETRKVA